jgi:hypothetical protein
MLVTVCRVWLKHLLVGPFVFVCVDMPASKASVEERTQKLLIRAKKIQSEGQASWLKKMMIKHCSCIPVLISTVESCTGERYMGSRSGEELPTVDVKRRKTLAIGEGNGEDHADDDKKDGVDEGADGGGGFLTAKTAEDMDEIPRDARLPNCITSWRIMSIAFIKAVLRELHEVVFSRYSIRALIPLGKREVPRDEAMKVIAHLTGFHDGTMITKELRIWGNLIDWIVTAMKKLTGDRLASLTMPPKWAADGATEMDALSDGTVIVRNKFTGKTGVVPQELLKTLNIKRGLFVEYNWSESEAAISDGSKVLTEKCASFIQDALGDPSLASRAKTTKNSHLIQIVTSPRTRQFQKKSPEPEAKGFDSIFKIKQVASVTSTPKPKASKGVASPKRKGRRVEDESALVPPRT